ncbi:MAG TPA: hypothetical protein VL484_10380 [Vicinamibacterales bacterium]|nr:hypothetical protein [Vicinamibacterales bacterium]
MTANGGLTREQAQARADRIRAFRAELAAAESDGAVTLTPDQRRSLDSYHDAHLASLTSRFDVDRTETQHQLSLGLRVVSLLGAVALTAAAILFFEQIWGLLPSAGQIAIVWGAPIGVLGAARQTARRERTLYFTALLAIVAFGCFVLNVFVLGAVLNARESALPLLLWAAFAFALAYAWNLRLLLAAGALCGIAFCAATAVSWSRIPWDAFFVRPEWLLLPAAATAAASQAHFNANRGGFPQTLRIVGFGTIAVAIVVLSSFGEASRLWLAPRTIEHFYQVVGFGYAIALIAAGVRRRWNESLNLGASLFGLLLLLRFVDWWWDWMPKYLFFLLVGATALLFMFVLRALRRSAAERHA